MRDREDITWYGVTPAGSFVALVIAVGAAGVVLLVLGATVLGVVLLVLGLAGAALRLSRSPALSARLATAGRLRALRREVEELARERDRKLRALGEAVYRDEAAATEGLRSELAELERAGEEKRAEMERILSEARLETAVTQAVPLEPYPPPDEGDVPDHPDLPEPYPPPDEGEIPEPPPPERE